MATCDVDTVIIDLKDDMAEGCFDIIQALHRLDEAAARDIAANACRVPVASVVARLSAPPPPRWAARPPGWDAPASD